MRYLIPKPKTPTIDWTKGLTRGLQMDWLLVEGGGTPIDRVLQLKAPRTGVNWTNQNGGTGLLFDTTETYARANIISPKQQFTRFVTIEAEFTRDGGGSGTTYGNICGLGQSTAFGGRIWLLENDNGNGGWGQTFQVWWNSQPGIWSIPYPSAGVKHHLVIIYDGGSTSNRPIFILDGILQTVTDRLGAVGSLRTGGSYFSIGNNAEAGVGSGGSWDGNIYRVRTWNRLLTLKEALELYRNPYQIYQKSRFFGKVPSAASGPANLKSRNGLAKASIKSINGLAIASIKSLNGLN